MAGKTKVDLKFEMTDGTNQVVSFEVPNGKDDDDGTGGTLKGNFKWWNSSVTAGNKSFTKNAKDLLLVVSINGMTQPPTVWQDTGTALVFAEGLQAGDVLNVLYLEGGK